jgi:hypothetical protein
MGQMKGSNLQTPVLTPGEAEFRREMALPAPDLRLWGDFLGVSPAILTRGL